MTDAHSASFFTRHQRFFHQAIDQKTVLSGTSGGSEGPSSSRENVEAGGLMFYRANYPDLFRRTGELVDTILRGAKPAEIPVEQPTRFDLVINMITAKTLGVTIPETLLATADEVVQ
jgi:hypothetical protein